VVVFPGAFYWAKTPIDEVDAWNKRGHVWRAKAEQPVSDVGKGAQAEYICPSIQCRVERTSTGVESERGLEEIVALFTSVYFWGAKSIIVPTTTHTSYSHLPSLPSHRFAGGTEMDLYEF
jgi:hypothetical protein